MEVSQIYVEKQSMKFFLIFVMTMLGNKYRLLSQIKNAFFFSTASQKYNLFWD